MSDLDDDNEYLPTHASTMRAAYRAEMDDEQAIRLLPQLCREAVRRHRAGLPIAVVAQELAIEPASARSLIEVAEAKIARLRLIGTDDGIE